MTALMLAAALIIALTLGYQFRKIITRDRLNCFHHDVRGGWPETQQATPLESYVRAQLIDSGMRKRFTCLKCDGVWFT